MTTGHVTQLALSADTPLWNSGLAVEPIDLGNHASKSSGSRTTPPGSDAHPTALAAGHAVPHFRVASPACHSHFLRRASLLFYPQILLVVGKGVITT
jgi:hypothetical protein